MTEGSQNLSRVGKPQRYHEESRNLTVHQFGPKGQEFLLIGEKSETEEKRKTMEEILEEEEKSTSARTFRSSWLISSTLVT